MDFIVPVSGGKDSQLVLAAMLEFHRARGERVRAVHNYTGIDHSLTYAHMRYMERRYGVKVEFTRSAKYEDVTEAIKGMGYFPSSLARGCTTELKLIPWIAWLFREGYCAAPLLAHAYFGMRAAESTTRQASYGNVGPKDIFTYADMSTSASHRKKGLENVTCSLPIVHLQTADVFARLEARGDRVNPLYKRGHSRVGCYPCILSKREEWELAARDPEGRKRIGEWVAIEKRWAKGGNPRKLIRVHETRDTAYLLKHGRYPEHQRRGMDDSVGGCGVLCEI